MIILVQGNLFAHKQEKFIINEGLWAAVRWALLHDHREWCLHTAYPHSTSDRRTGVSLISIFIQSKQ